MPKRSILLLIVLNLCFPLIYHFYWLYKTKHEMTDRGAEIPTTLLAFIPLVHYYFLWKWSVGAEQVTRGKMSSGIAFVLMAFLGWIIGPAIVQVAFNETPDDGIGIDLPRARVVV